MIWMTADLHLGHQAILRYCDRPFMTIGEMDMTLINNWNSVVEPGDTIYMIGDFVLGKSNVAARYFNKLYGKIKVIPGGHDYKWLRDKKAFYSLSGKKVDILPPLFTLKTDVVEDSKAAVLCHYSMRTWDRSHYGSVHFFGHSHGRLEGYGRSCDVGIDVWDYTPVSLKRAYDYINKKIPWEKRRR